MKNVMKTLRCRCCGWDWMVSVRGGAGLLAGMLAVLLTGCCGDREDTEVRAPAPVTNSVRSATAASRAMILAVHSGSGRIDEEIRQAQEQVRNGHLPQVALERLGWLFVGKARESFDPGYYTLAEHCALVLDAAQPGAPEAVLLRGHALQSQHRFNEAEPLARQLVKSRGLPSDHGLLGDILADVGRVDEAVAAYQAMLDLKPDPQGYARASHVRWVKGDLEGAIELMRMAVAGVSSREGESAAWMHTQLARYLWQVGQDEPAARSIAGALALRPEFAPALHLRGKMLLAQGQVAGAVQALARAAQLNPLPEYQWALAESFQAAGREAEAKTQAELVIRRGRAADPRACSLYLATCRQQPELAVRLARQELRERADILTHDALAWALATAGDVVEARKHLQQALAQGTRDARLALHAGVILGLAQATDESRRWLAQAQASRAQLLPSEQARLDEALALAVAPAGPRPGAGPIPGPAAPPALQISSAPISGAVQEP